MPETKTDDSRKHSNILIADNLRFLQQSASPGTPPSGQLALFTDSNGRLWAKNDAGVEYPLMALDLIEVQKGNVAGHSIVHKFGRDDAVPNGTWRLISELNQDAATTHLAAATTVRVKAGGDAADTAAGAGAQAVTVVGIGVGLTEISESIELAGSSASASTSASFWRPYRAFITPARCGAYNKANTADIVIENTAGTVDLLQIGTEEGQSEHGAYTIPAGKTGYFLGAAITVHTNKSADFRLMSRANFNDVTTPFEPIRIMTFLDGISGEVNYHPAAPLILPALTDVWWESIGEGATTEVAVDFEILLVDN